MSPFDALLPRAERLRRDRRERVILFAVRAPDLKDVIMASYFDGTLSQADVHALFKQYGLRSD